MKIITIKRASDSAIISTIAQIGNPASVRMSKYPTKDLVVHGIQIFREFIVRHFPEE